MKEMFADSLTQHAARYRDLVQEYCDLSAQLQLSDGSADRIEAILAQAEADPLLSFLLDEADHMLNHLHHCIDAAAVAEQQAKLKHLIDKNWPQQVLQDAAAQLQQSQRKSLQHFLKERGLYGGVIDGVVGPLTQAALRDCGDLPNQPVAPPEPINLPDLQEC